MRELVESVGIMRDDIGILKIEAAEIKKDVAHTKQLSEKTNGRVTRLERAWSYARGFAAAVALAVGALGATGHLHIH